MAAGGITEDYNQIAATYDEFFSGFMAPHARQLAQKIPLPGGPARVLDLACGTGTLMRAMGARLGADSALTGVDRSEKMMDRARQNAPRSAAFFQDDMMRFVRKAPECSYDIVTCGWALGYVRPQTLIKEIRRILTPGGVVGLIENQKSTLSEIRETGIKVMRRYPQYIRRVMDLTLRLPSDKEQLRGWLRNAGLKKPEVWEGQVEFRFKNGLDVLNWVLRTGASAGFDRMMAREAKPLCDKAFVEIIESDYMRNGQIKTAHRFVAGIAQK